MMRRVAYGKAVAAGMAGAIVWELMARPMLMSGLPIGDIVRLLGTIALPESQGLGWWLVGMALHLVVGALWAVFYAYFFWSLLPVKPWLQGLAFAFVPMPLAIFVMKPQLELMNSLVAKGDIPSSSLFGLDGGWLQPLSVAIAHLLWGATLGYLYVRPVGHRASQTSHLFAQGRPPRSEAKSTHTVAPLRFLFTTGIESSYPTIESGRWRLDLLEATGHYRNWQRDLENVADLGVRFLRYGPPLYATHEGPGRYNWSFTDDVVEGMQRLGIEPIMDLCHFGLPRWLCDFQNPEVPAALAEYAAAFACRYPTVRLYTPINEMYVCARLSALEGAWNEQRSDERSYVTATRHLAKASVLMMQRITEQRPDAIFINSESSEFYQACCPDPGVRVTADFENERRFLPLDLLYARPVGRKMREHLRECGMPDVEYDWFMSQDVRHRSVLGIDYYDWNEKLIDRTGKSRALGELFGWMVIASQYYARYGRPLMHTETNHRDAREAPRWLWRQWHNVQLLRSQGVPVVGFTWYSLTDQVDWDIALREARGVVNPVGLFDLNGDVRTVGQAYQHLISLYESEMQSDPELEATLRLAAGQSARGVRA